MSNLILPKGSLVELSVLKALKSTCTTQQDVKIIHNMGQLRTAAAHGHLPYLALHTPSASSLCVPPREATGTSRRHGAAPTSSSLHELPRHGMPAPFDLPAPSPRVPQGSPVPWSRASCSPFPQPTLSTCPWAGNFLGYNLSLFSTLTFWPKTYAQYMFLFLFLNGKIGGQMNECCPVSTNERCPAYH